MTLWKDSCRIEVEPTCGREYQDFVRLPMTLKFFMTMMNKPEPDKLELLADVLEIEDIKKNFSV